MEIKRKSTDRSAKCELFVGRPFPENNNKQREKAFLQERMKSKILRPRHFLKTLCRQFKANRRPRDSLRWNPPLKPSAEVSKPLAELPGNILHRRRMVTSKTDYSQRPLLTSGNTQYCCSVM